jgi:hypothetical protein
MTPAVAVKARCALCNADLIIGEVLRINGRHLLVVQPCSKCNGSPRQGRLDGRPGVAAPGQKKR